MEHTVKFLLDLRHLVEFVEICRYFPLDAEVIEQKFLLWQSIEASGHSDWPLVAAYHEKQKDDGETHADLHTRDDYHLRTLLQVQLRQVE